MKKVISAILTIAMLLAVFAVPVCAYSDEQSHHLTDIGPSARLLGYPDDPWTLDNGDYTGSFEIANRVSTNYYYLTDTGKIKIDVDTYYVDSSNLDNDSFRVEFCKRTLTSYSLLEKNDMGRNDSATFTFSGLDDSTKYFFMFYKANDGFTVAGDFRIYD